jgi:hypothetical protein
MIGVAANTAAVVWGAGGVIAGYLQGPVDLI